MLELLKDKGFEIELHAHAAAILKHDFPAALGEIEDVLSSVHIPITAIIGSGGGEAKGTQRLRRALAEKGWTKVCFEIKKTINGIERESVSHEVDHVRTFPEGKLVALEIEWNNKDPFFDRDLENFKRLHSEGAISVGIIVTRGSSLQDDMPELVRRFAAERNVRSFDDLAAIDLYLTRRQREEVGKRINRARGPLSFADAWASHFVQDKFGAATTHWRKLQDRVHRGVGNPCPLLLIGLPASIVTFDTTARIEEPPRDEGGAG